MKTSSLNIDQNKVFHQFAEITGYISKTARKKSNMVVFKGPNNVWLRQYLKVHFRYLLHSLRLIAMPDKVNRGRMILFLNYAAYTSIW